MPKKKTSKVQKEDSNIHRDITEEDMNRLRKVAKANEKDLDSVLIEWDAEYKTLEEAGITENRGHLAVFAVMNNYRRIKLKQKPSTRKKKETTTIYGFIVGDKGVWDKAEQVRKQVKTFIDKNGIQAAQEAQMVDGENHILDQRQKLYGRDNPKYLKPLDPNLHVLERTIFGFFRHNGEKTFKWGSMQTSDNRLARGWSKIKFYKPCQVTAVVREESAEDITLGSSSAEESLSVFKAIQEDWDVKKIIDDYLGEHKVDLGDKKGVVVKEQWTPIKDVEKHHEAFKDAWDRHIFVKGVVAWINTDRPTPWGAVWMGLMNPDNEDDLVRVLIPEQVAIDFGELSEVYVFGKTNRTQYKDQETQKLTPGDVKIDAFGIFPTVPTPKENTSAESLKEEEEVEGWLE